MAGSNVRARIGMIYPASGLMENEFVKLAPPDVAVHITRIQFERASVQENLKMANNVEEAARILSLAKVDLIHFNCTTGSLIGGPSYDKIIIKKMQKKTGIPSLTTTTSVLLALRALGVHRIALLAPYPKEIVEPEKQFFESNGIAVPWTHAESIDDPIEQGTTKPSKWIELAKSVPTTVDALFISCGGIEIVDFINEIESRLDHPVITSNQASMWACLRKLGLKDKSDRWGQLLREF